MATLPVSTAVDISTSIRAGGVLRTQFGTGLLVTLDDALPAGGSNKAQVFADIESVNRVLSAGDALDAATVWFGADPPPKSLYIGRWATVDVATTLQGGTPGSQADIAVANASLRINDADLTVDLSAATTYAAIATALQAAIASGRVDGVTITAGGTNYAAATTTVAFAGGGATRQATGTVLISAGVVTGVTVTDAGEGYTSAPTVTITDTGAGTGATATAVLGGITSALSGATFTYSTAGAFLLTLAGADDIGYMATHSQGTGTDVSGLLGMRLDSTGVDYKAGHDAEAVVDAVGEMTLLASGATPVALMRDVSTPQLHNGIDTDEALSAYAQAGDYVYGQRDTDPQALVTGDTTSKSARVFANQQSHVEPIYTKPGELPDIGLLALMSSQNLNQPASIITPHLKALPNVRPTEITLTQLNELQRKRTNIYTSVANLPGLFGGYTGRAGSWLDAVWWLLWLKNEHELQLYNAQRASRRFNTGILKGTLMQIMAVAERSGGMQPGGRVNAATAEDIRQTTGNQAFDGVLAAGYITWVERVSSPERSWTRRIASPASKLGLRLRTQYIRSSEI